MIWSGSTWLVEILWFWGPSHFLGGWMLQSAQSTVGLLTGRAPASLYDAHGVGWPLRQFPLLGGLSLTM